MRRAPRLTLVLAVSVVPLLAWAGWPTSSTTDLVAARTAQPLAATLLAGPDGGLWATWTDQSAYATLQGEAFLEQVTAAGELTLNTATDGGLIGKPLLSAAGDQLPLATCRDAQGGFFLAWRDGIYNLRVGRFGADGTPVAGFNTFLATGNFAELRPDGSGGAWLLYGSEGASESITHLDSAGIPLAGPAQVGAADIRFWSLDLDDTGLTTLWSNYLQPHVRGFTPNLQPRYDVIITGNWASGSRYAVVSDNRGGGWFFGNNAAGDVFLQHVYADGGVQFLNDAGLAEATPVSHAINLQTLYEVAADGVGGAYLVYNDDRGAAGVRNLYIQRVDATGAFQWNVGNDGLLVTTTTVSNRAAGRKLTVRPGQDVTVVWAGEGPAEIRAQRYSIDGGAIAWPFSGVSVSAPPSSFHYPRVLTAVQQADGTVVTMASYYDGSGSNLPEVRLKKIPNDGLFFDAGTGAGGGTGSGGGSGAGGGGGTGGGSAGTGGGGSAGTGGGSPGTGGGSAGTGGGSAGGGSGGTGGGNGGGGTGCGCNASDPAAWSALVVLGAWVRRRAARRAGSSS